MFYAELIKSIPNYHQILTLISVPSNAQAGSHNRQRSLFGEEPGRVAQSLGHLTHNNNNKKQKNNNKKKRIIWGGCGGRGSICVYGVVERGCSYIRKFCTV